jgi:hypothetical protein
MKYAIILSLFFLIFSAEAQTRVFAEGADSASVFEQLDMQFGAALDTVVVVRFQINEKGEATDGEVVRVYCKSCAESVVRKAKAQALDELISVDGLSLKQQQGLKQYYLLPVQVNNKKYVKQKKAAQ